MNASSPNLNPSQIKIFLCVPRCFIKTFNINTNSQIGCLMHNDEYKYVFNGNIINPNQTFNDIGTVNGSVFVAFKSEQEHGSFNHQWIKLSKDSSFESKLHSLASKRTKKEYYRLRDIRDLKVEGSLKLYRKMAHKLFLKKEKENDDPINFDYEVNYEPSSEPCTDAMPILW